MLEWEQSKNLTEVKSFLSLTGYYREFIRKFSQIALLLRRLTRKDHPFVLDHECEEEFSNSKDKIDHKPCTSHSRPILRF